MTPRPTVLPLGDRAVLVETGDALRALSLATWARGAGLVADEIVPAAQTVMFAGLDDPTALLAALDAWPDEPPEPSAAVVELPVSYDGPDLAYAAQAWGVDVSEVPGLHARQDFVVAFCGFAPGFAYLAGLPAELALPRLATPRTRVPAGSVAVADAWTGVYPSASPGGWRLLGRTTVPLFDPSAAQPALLVPGTRVRLVPQ
ncbi:MAG: allophanate hydrolase subunit 1 [Nocardioidaceae bacterium]